MTLYIDKVLLQILAMIDCGSTWNFLSQIKVKEAALRIPVEAPPPSELKILDGTPLQVGVVDDKVVEVRADQTFVGADMFGVDMILGIPWLDQVDPVIRWHERKLFHVRLSENEDGQASLHEVYDLETGEPVVERAQVPRRYTSNSHPDRYGGSGLQGDTKAVRRRGNTSISSKCSRSRPNGNSNWFCD